EDADIMCLPTGYSTSATPLSELCNDCYEILSENGGGTVLICGHSIHWHCYERLEKEKEDNILELEKEPQDSEDTEEPEDIQENETVIDLQSSNNNDSANNEEGSNNNNDSTNNERGSNNYNSANNEEGSNNNNDSINNEEGIKIDEGADSGNINEEGKQATQAEQDILEIYRSKFNNYPFKYFRDPRILPPTLSKSTTRKTKLSLSLDQELQDKILHEVFDEIDKDYITDEIHNFLTDFFNANH
ncbi:18632_t:CDS:2, partial [Gigaspora rosea]